MTADISNYKEIIESFRKIPIKEQEPTFMELCHYSGERFEEICTRILEFYFKPNEIHGFSDLWINALCKCKLIGCDCSSNLSLETQREEYTTEAEKDKYKKIDLILKTPDFVIAIENKIGADLYNPLEIYKDHVEKKYKNLKTRFFIVLTAFNLKKEEIDKTIKYEFRIVSYKELFDNVRGLLGKYIASCNYKYLAFMMDFMTTIENKIGFMENTELNKFFEERYNDIEKLCDKYQKWKNNVIDYLFTSIKTKTQDESWKIYSESNKKRLICSFYEDTEYNIGIEAFYKPTQDDYFGEFHIHFRTWGKGRWENYEKEVNEKYGYHELEKIDESHSLYNLDNIKKEGELNYEEKILEELTDCYNFLKILTIKKMNK